MKVAIVLAVFLLICGLIGLKMGVLRMAYGTFCLVASIVMSVIFCPVVTTFLADNINLDTYVSGNVQSMIEEQLGESVNLGTKEVQKTAIQKLHIPASWQKKILKYRGDEDMYKKLGVGTFTEMAAQVITTNSMKALTFFFLFVFLAIALRLVTAAFRIMNLLAKLPVFKEANKSTGLVLGVIMGMLAIGVVMAFLPSLAQFTWGQKLADAINTDQFASFLYRHNLFLWIISKL